jgi:hypothetical protein
MLSAPDSLEIREADLLGRGLRDRANLCEEDNRDETGDGDGDDNGRETIEESSNVEECLPWPSGREATEAEEAESCSRRGGEEWMEGREEGVGSTVDAAALVAGAASGDAAAWEAATGVPATPSPPAASTEVCDWEETDGVEGITSISTSAAQSVEGGLSVRAGCTSSVSLSISSAG